MTELVKLNKLHFKSTLRPQQALRIPANSKPQAAIVASVCPAPAPTCPAPSRRPQTGWAIGVGVALLGAAVAAYAYNLVKGKKLAVAQETQSQPPASGFASPLPATPIITTETVSLPPAEIVSSVATAPPAAEAPAVLLTAEAAASPVVVEEASTATLQQAVTTPISPPSHTIRPSEPVVASTSVAETEAAPAPLAPTELPTPSLPEAAPVEATPTVSSAPGGENGRAAKAPEVVLTSVKEEAQKQQPESVTPEVSASAVAENATEVSESAAEEIVPEVTASAVIEEAEVTPSVVIKEEEPQNGAAAAAAEPIVSGHEDTGASDTRVALTDILPDGLVPLEAADVVEKQPQVRTQGFAKCLLSCKDTVWVDI